MLTVRRRVDAGEDRWLAYAVLGLDTSTDEASPLAYTQIHHKQLRGCVVVEQSFVGAYRSFFAVALLNDWSIRDLGFGRRCAAIRGNRLHQERVAARQPLESLTHHRIDLKPLDADSATKDCIAYPEFGS